MKFSLSQLLVFIAILSMVIAYRETIAKVVFADDAPFLPVLVSLIFISIISYVMMQSGYALLMTSFYSQFGMLTVLRILLGRHNLGFHLNQLSVQLLEDGNITSSMKAITKAIELNPNEGAHWVGRGMILKEAGKLDEALSDLSRGLKLNPNLSNARILRGYIYIEKNMYENALEELLHHQCKDRSDGQVAYVRGAAREQLHDWVGAAKDYQLAWKLDPSLNYAIIAYARLQAACPEESLRDGHKAIENASRICTLTDWSDWVSLSVLAAAYAETGDFESAVKFAQQAHQFAPDDEKQIRAARIELYKSSVPLRLPLNDGN